MTLYLLKYSVTLNRSLTIKPHSLFVSDALHKHVRVLPYQFSLQYGTDCDVNARSPVCAVVTREEVL